MSLIEATIRVHCDQKSRVIDVEYGVGSSRVPNDCLRVRELASPLFETGVIFNLQQKLLSRMPDIVFNVVHGIGFPSLSHLVNEEKN